MTIIAWIVLGIIVVVALATMAFELLSKLLEGATAFVAGVIATTQNTLRLLALKGKAVPVLFIPEELMPNASLIYPSTDPELQNLRKWSPPEPKQAIPKKAQFESGLKDIYPHGEAKSARIFIDDLSHLQIPSLGIGPLFAQYPVPLEYPVDPPPTPQEIPDLPSSYTHWEIEVPEPTLTLPLYGARFDFLNRWVRELHTKEIADYEAAMKRRESILDEIKRRNQAAQQALEQADRYHDRLVKLRDTLIAESVSAYEADRKEFLDAVQDENARINKWSQQCEQPGGPGLLARLELCLRMVQWPSAIPRRWEARFDTDSGILIVEHQFPDIGGVEWVKQVELKNGITTKPANKTEQKQACAKLYPTLCLRLAVEAVQLDREEILAAVAVNGWAMYQERTTGQDKRAYCASLFATRAQVVALKMETLDPEAAFRALKGLANTHSLELIPIAPIVRLNMDDPRFVDAKEVIDKLNVGENLAAMDWEDFEHLSRELFERAFASTGAEVKVTQASRDQGVDAVIFDPDPLRGGKLIVQAKRYTNTVDVSAVRDLYGAVINEGAIKGILVTTSHFGPEAYSFAKDKPITLINGEELLGLLAQHGYKFRIDLAEARALANR